MSVSAFSLSNCFFFLFFLSSCFPFFHICLFLVVLIFQSHPSIHPSIHLSHLSIWPSNCIYPSASFVCQICFLLAPIFTITDCRRHLHHYTTLVPLQWAFVWSLTNTTLLSVFFFFLFFFVACWCELVLATTVVVVGYRQRKTWRQQNYRFVLELSSVVSQLPDQNAKQFIVRFPFSGSLTLPPNPDSCCNFKQCIKKLLYCHCQEGSNSNQSPIGVEFILTVCHHSQTGHGHGHEQTDRQSSSHSAHNLNSGNSLSSNLT